MTTTYLVFVFNYFYITVKNSIFVFNIIFCLQEYPDYKYKPRKKLKPHERGHKPRGRRPANPDAPKKPRATRTPAPKRRGKAKLLLASLRQGRAAMAPLRQPPTQPQPGIYSLFSNFSCMFLNPNHFFQFEF